MYKSAIINPTNLYNLHVLITFLKLHLSKLRKSHCAYSKNVGSQVHTIEQVLSLSLSTSDCKFQTPQNIPPLGCSLQRVSAWFPYLKLDRGTERYNISFPGDGILVLFAH